MRFGIRTKLVLAFEATVVIPVLVFLAEGSSKSGGVENALALIVAQSVLLIACTSIVSSIIIRSVLKPLEELHQATEKIMSGDLDYEIQYKKNNEMGRYCQAFEQMRVQLKESLRRQAALEHSRKELIASISHDLRTPLSSIRGYVEGLEDGIVRDREKFSRYIAVIKNKTECLDNQIENLFQYSRLELSGGIQNLCRRNSEELLEAILRPYEVEFTDCQIRFEIVRPFPKVEILASENSLSQVFDNLIANAKRYVGENGAITVLANADDRYLTVSVSDNGSGLSPEDLPYVFEQFYRAEKSRSRHYGGAGLGLAICKKTIENHGGTIWVESTPNIVTTFSFTLPIV
ncbi:HAMP domain-containing histidine kinase [Paenibacillus doosanensis]|uniref:histidine kinase n=1 Tax=Paenibacillus konkukensis TaxID=2020716 RepID=A0ABY4RXQ2_9BACL|nr:MULTISPECIES: HAMP domain-containing sensor histidine kinase [Paenibacillus]MCS7460386.1 HAMP domain-containing histidine kinase [Paenibacillus doosanensis]UQZ87436.1 Sensor histidine kinase YycG [Paenibacillus konkukensis]